MSGPFRDRIIVAWERFWFAPGSSTNLAAARIAVALHALWILASRDYAAMSGVPPIFWNHAPTGVLLRFLIVPGHPAFESLLQHIAFLALIGAIFGIAPRLCCAIAALVLYHLAPLEASIWTGAPEGRGMTLAPVALLVLAVAPSGAALAIWPRTRGASRLSEEYGWAVRLLQLLVCEIYLFSAIGKMERVGLLWGSPRRIQLWFYWFNQDSQGVVFGSVGPWMARFPILCAAVGLATFLLEWGMPLALFSPRARRVLVPAALLFHVGVLVSMNIHVPEAWLLVVFINWQWLADRLGDSAPNHTMG